MRYFTVGWSSVFSHGNQYEHVEAADGMDAVESVMCKIRSASVARVVREIDRAEFERLTGIQQRPEA